MNTTRKITIKHLKMGTFCITYPTDKQLDAAFNIMRQLNNMRKTIVPCDTETGKTEKMIDVSSYKASIVE
ncbi:hypothetical protein [Sharpea azabuensis]|uniref:hypothetical protein n=1 Tax=Sharpea azabuensis TaxID=322505 RepID=UPI001568A73A|nr:hypothetical protein [Sharpea azabuensis]